MTEHCTGRHLSQPWESSPAPRLAPVSVVIPCYNSASSILRALASVANQTMPPAEVVMVDDASTDGSSELAESYAQVWKASQLVIIRQPANEGPSAARNIGWQRASLEWVAFLDADDAWHPGKLERCLAAADSVSGRVDLIGHRCPAAMEARWQPIPERFKLKYPVGREILWHNIFPTSSVMLRRDLPYRFDPTRRRSEDYLLWMTIILAGRRALWLDLPLAQAFKSLYGAGGLSGDLWAMEAGELATYSSLVSGGLISPGQGRLLELWSLTKFARRWVLTSVGVTGKDASDAGLPR